MPSVKQLEMYVNRAALGASELANNEMGVNVYRFFKRMEAEKGWVTEIARNNGPGPGVGTGLNYHNEANPAVAPFWAYFRWEPSARRPKASYILLQYGVSPTISSGVGAPARIQGGTNFSSQAIGFTWCGYQDNLGVAQNPWGGSPATSKGTPVFVTPGVGERLDILPLSNAPGGSHATNRENLAGIGHNISWTTSARMQMVADQDNICIQSSKDASASNWFFLLGAYIPLPGVSVDHPVVMLNMNGSTSVAGFTADMSAIGTTTGTNAAEGGIIAPAGVRVANTQANYAMLLEAGYQPNPNISGSAWDTEKVYVGVNGGGRLGAIDPAFLVAAGQVPWGTVFDSGARVAVDFATAGRARAVIIWDSATTPGAGADRVGVPSAT
jgi:hypothetical protein